ncbi:DNA repair helicase [Piedraia hortae CBS 480.64]|uniref:ATP-dependent DNA helicase CHL1 n=1 Tax=Piedraia hortae CBS 480.64 TaxID=1314780 RepID=A0A6A7BVX8_9PEZI|nr:DNA repair helicase [Piedraia hortae CBS 480.64]
MAKDFHHPFKPYGIQLQFMEALYDCIEKGQVGIFESPTGTGKSLSLICGALTWLRDHKRKTFDEAVTSIEINEDEPDWMIEHARKAKRRELQQAREDLEARLRAARKREDKIRERARGEPLAKRRKIDDKKEVKEEDFLLDYDSDEQGTKPAFANETIKLMEELGMLQKESKDDYEEEVDELKIFVCSRTHSQLSQFVGELQRVRLPPGLPDDEKTTEDLKHLSLGSRQNLCINPKVVKLDKPTAINERCIELQKPGIPTDEKCPFLPGKDNQDLVLDFRDHALARVRDIEDAAGLGRKLGICPYYASRSAIGPAEVVTLPYPLLLQKSARDALGISLKHHVVIIDEAHNLMDAIEGVHTATITQIQLKRARELLMVYLQKFKNRLKGGNGVHVAQVVRVIDSLLSFTTSLTGPGGTAEPSQLLSGKGVDQINLAKLVRYMTQSKLARKVECYVSQVSENVGKDETEVPTLTQIQNFFMALMNPSKEGRFFWSTEGDDHVLRYMLLDPSEPFRDVVDSARAVVLVGGTMSPMTDYKRQLFPYLSEVTTFSCGHLVPPSSLHVGIIASDQEGPVEFSFKSRNKANFRRIGVILAKLAPLAYGGMVVFFPSYGFLTQVLEAWHGGDFLKELKRHKPLFCDSRTGSTDAMFNMYGEAIKKDAKRGAMLLSVIGGKLSEGINFADDLGRCVVVVGLPFPNLDTPEWKTRMRYLEAKAAERGEARGSASKEHAENVCMRSVNQAIGRVIRHKDDWASIVLLDARYGREGIQAKLPGWIRASLSTTAPTKAEKVMQGVASFSDMHEAVRPGRLQPSTVA